jgi:DNA-binding transcriptional LysR family regulator
VPEHDCLALQVVPCLNTLMELRHLRYFVAVGELLNFRRAAEKLHIAQSPLSQQIRRLEEELGFELFTRAKGRVYLTHAGSIFLEEARAILDKSATAKERARRGSQGDEGSLVVGYLTSMANDTLSRIVKTFQKDLPTVGLSLNDLVPSSILRGLLDKTIDVGFLRGVFETEDLGVAQVWREGLVLALPRYHRLAGSSHVKTEDLAKEHFIMVPDQGSMGYNDAIRELCGRAGFAPRVRAEANQMQAVIWLVDMGLGIALVPGSLRALGRKNVVYRPISNSPSVPGMMVWRKEDASPVLRRFRDVTLKLVQLNLPA